MRHEPVSSIVVPVYEDPEGIRLTLDSILNQSTDRAYRVVVVDNGSEDETAAVLDRAERAGVPTVEAIRLGVPHRTIRKYADAEGVDLVVMGTHGRTGVEHALVGSVTERVVRTLDVPVLTVHPGSA